MTVIAFVFLFGLFDGGPASFPEEHYIRITDEVDLPDMERTRPIAARPGWRAGLYHEARFGARASGCLIAGQAAVDAAQKALGPPLSISRRDEPRQGYMWRWRENPSQGFLIIVQHDPPSLYLKGWHLRPESRTTRVNSSIEDRVYKWFKAMARQ